MGADTWVCHAVLPNSTLTVVPAAVIAWCKLVLSCNRQLPSCIMQPDIADAIWLHKACGLAQKGPEPNVVVEGHLTSMTERTFFVLLHIVLTDICIQ